MPDCNAPIHDRSGRPLDYTCNLEAGHLGRHVQAWAWQGNPGVAILEMAIDECQDDEVAAG